LVSKKEKGIPNSIGHEDCTSTSMFKEELKAKIEKLEQELSTKDREYIDAIRSRKDYNTLRSIRDSISELKNNLKSLHDGNNESDSNIKL
jgi:cell division protein FtsB